MAEAEDILDKAWIKIIQSFENFNKGVLRSFGFINEKTDFNDKSSYVCHDVSNFCIKTAEFVSEDFQFYLKKQHLKTSILADNN